MGQGTFAPQSPITCPKRQLPETLNASFKVKGLTKNRIYCIIYVVKTLFMRKQIILLLIFSFVLFNVSAKEAYNDEMSDRTNEYDISGFLLQFTISLISNREKIAYNYFAFGLGYNWGSYRVNQHHFLANDYGFIIEYKFMDELRARLYYDIYGGSTAVLLGGSGIIATNFDYVTIGIAPHIGIGLPFGLKMFYRYNFYLNNTFNSHEIVFILRRDKNA